MGQILSTKINLSKFYDCKWHLLILIRVLAELKIFYVSIWDQLICNICKKKCKKHAFMFFPPLQWPLDIFNIHLLTLSIGQFCCWLTRASCYFKKSKLLSFSTFWSTTPLSNSIHGCKWQWHLRSIENLFLGHKLPYLVHDQ